MGGLLGTHLKLIENEVVPIYRNGKVVIYMQDNVCLHEKHYHEAIKPYLWYYYTLISQVQPSKSGGNTILNEIVFYQNSLFL